MEYIPDAYDMWKIHEEGKERRLKRRPICFECGEHIQEDYGYQFSGTWMCSECIEQHKVEIKEW